MLLQYVQAAMRGAQYRPLPDAEGFFGEIPGFQGVWANADTLEQCQLELQEVLEDWIVVRLRHNLDLPVVDGIDLNVKPQQEVA